MSNLDTQQHFFTFLDPNLAILEFFVYIFKLLTVNQLKRSLMLKET